MRRALSVLVLSATLGSTALSAPVAADPPREVTVGIRTISFTPMPETRRQTGKVVHFEFRVSAFVSGEQPGITSEHFTCVRRVGDVIRCSGDVVTDYLDGDGRTESHVRVTCDARLVVCEGLTHLKGVDNAGATVRGSGRVSLVGGVGSATLRLTHG